MGTGLTVNRGPTLAPKLPYHDRLLGYSVYLSARDPLDEGRIQFFSYYVFGLSSCWRQKRKMKKKEKPKIFSTFAGSQATARNVTGNITNFLFIFIFYFFYCLDLTMESHHTCRFLFLPSAFSHTKHSFNHCCEQIIIIFS